MSFDRMEKIENMMDGGVEEIVTSSVDKRYARGVLYSCELSYIATAGMS